MPKSKRHKKSSSFSLIDMFYPSCLNRRTAVLDGNDLKAIKDIIEVAVGEVIEKKQLVKKSDISHLPTKDEFYGKMDEVMGELKTIREEVVVLGHQVSDYGDRLEKLQPEQNASSN